MAFNQSTASSVPVINVQYSATIGALYVRNAENDNKLKSIKAEVGETDWKKGFQGPDSKAVQLAKKNGFTGGNVSGVLTSLWIKPVEADGRVYNYLTVGLKDKASRAYLSMDITSEAAQKLARKLVNCQPGVETEISIFATMDPPKEGKSRAFASHGASVKQNGAQVPGVAPADKLAPMVNAALQVLKDNGVDDKETLNKRRAKVTADYHIELVTTKSEEIDAFYKARELSHETETAESIEIPPVDAYNEAFDHLGDDTPF